MPPVVVSGWLAGWRSTLNCLHEMQSLGGVVFFCHINASQGNMVGCPWKTGYRAPLHTFKCGLIIFILSNLCEIAAKKKERMQKSVLEKGFRFSNRMKIIVS